MTRQYDPDYNASEAPDMAHRTDNGLVEVWFRPNNNPPKDYDYSVPHRTKQGHSVFFRLVPFVILLMATGIILCLVTSIVP